MPDLDAHRCVFCGEIVAPGDRIACLEHRRRMDAERMPWDAPETVPPPLPARRAVGGGAP